VTSRPSVFRLSLMNGLAFDLGSPFVVAPE
jgi:hypothetical protein